MSNRRGFASVCLHGDSGHQPVCSQRRRVLPASLQLPVVSSPPGGHGSEPLGTAAAAGDAGDCWPCSLPAGGEGPESCRGSDSQAETGLGWHLPSFPGVSPLCRKHSVLPVRSEEWSGFTRRSSFRLRLSSL